MPDLLYIGISLLLYGWVFRQNAAWGFFGITGSLNLVGVLGQIGNDLPIPWSMLLRDACVFLILLWIWIYTRKSAPEHIRYRVRH